MNMECILEDNLLRIKSDMFLNPEIVQMLDYSFMDFLKSFFDAYHVENIEQFVHDWYRLKDEFGRCLSIFISLGIFVCS